MENAHIPEQVNPNDRIAEVIAREGLAINCEFVPFSQSRNKDSEHLSLNWKVTLARKGRDVLTCDYSQGIGHAPSYSKKFSAALDKKRFTSSGNATIPLRDRLVSVEAETGRVAEFDGGLWGIPTKRKLSEPDIKDVLCSLIVDADVLDYATFEEWADCFGYDSDSRSAEKIYKLCLDTALQLRAGLGDGTLRELADLFRDY